MPSALLTAALLVFCAAAACRDNLRSIADGIYIPDQFSFSGGTGRVSISCPRVEIRAGQAYATLVFDSGTYSYVRSDGQTCQGTNTAETSTFEVPVRLNQDHTIIGCTTKMSAPHEITYEICVRLNHAAGGDDLTAGGGMNTGKDMAHETAQETEAATGEKTAQETETADKSRMNEKEEDGTQDREEKEEWGKPPKIDGLTYRSQLVPEYAKMFRIYYYDDGFTVVDVKDSFSYLVVPKGTKVPKELPDKMTVLERPLNHVYVAGTAAMALFHALGGLDEVRFSALTADGWYVDAAREAMEDGRIKFAGKYSEPDYELLLNEGCDLAVESQMIRHAPKVSEMLERMEIPVFVDCASNEEHPLGRTEWVRVYGALLDKEEEADAFFKEQTKILDSMEGLENTGQSVVYFYINSNGQAVVRSGTDYIAKMIGLAGGRYPFESLKDESKSSVTISMEEFYAVAADADYLIYNASIDGRLRSVAELTAKDEI